MKEYLSGFDTIPDLDGRQTDRQVTDRHLSTANTALMHSIA